MGNRNKHKPKNLLHEFKEKQKQSPDKKSKEEYIEEETGGLLCTYNEEATPLPKNDEEMEKFKEGAFKKSKQIKKTNIKFIF